MPHLDLERLVCAGAIDKQFGKLLLQDPLEAANGYYGDRFRLTAEEKAVITSIHTKEYHVLVQVVAAWISQKRASQLASSRVLPAFKVLA